MRRWAQHSVLQEKEKKNPRAEKTAWEKSDISILFNRMMLAPNFYVNFGSIRTQEGGKNGKHFLLTTYCMLV